MAMLNPPEILPPLMRSVLEATNIAGRPVDEERLIEMLSPGGDEESGSIGVKEKRHVVHTFGAARDLGLLSASETGWILSRVTEDAMERGTLKPRWLPLFRRAVLEHESAQDAVREAAEQNTRGVRDLIFALTWFSAQDALAEPIAWESAEGYRGFHTLQQQAFGGVTSRWPVQNDTRFGAFERWSLHLGFAVGDERGGRALRPLPIGIVRDTVGEIAAGTYDIEAFCRMIGDAVPCLWPGRLRGQLVELLGEEPDPDANAGGIDSSIATCLLVLESEQRLRLSALADAAQRRIITPRADQPRPVTHVEVLA